MQSHVRFRSSGLFGKLISSLLILWFCVTGGVFCRTFAQASDKSSIARLLPGALAGRTQYQVELANAYLRTNRPEDLREATYWYRLAATSGDPRAQTELGMMFESGIGMSIDLTQAREWYRRAVGSGYRPAMVLLASLYSAGKGVLQDREEALHLLERAAEQGYTPAKTDLAVLYLFSPEAPRRDADAIRLLHKAAMRDPKAAFVLGWCYQRERGVHRDLVRAAQWYTRAAGQEFAAAENNLAFLFETGGGVAVDQVAALFWYRRAAEHGISEATLSVAKLLLAGSERVRDRNAALVWFAIARRLGVHESQSELVLDRVIEEANATEREAIDSEAAGWLHQYRPANHSPLLAPSELVASGRMNH